MKVLGINESPHENGNTAYALRCGLSLLEDARAEVEYVGKAEDNELELETARNIGNMILRILGA